MENNSEFNAEVVSVMIESILSEWRYGSNAERVSSDIFAFLEENSDFKMNKVYSKKDKCDIVVLKGNRKISNDNIELGISLKAGYPLIAPVFNIFNNLESCKKSWVNAKTQKIKFDYCKFWSGDYGWNLNDALNMALIALKEAPPKLQNNRKSKGASSKLPEFELNEDDKDTLITTLTSRVEFQLWKNKGKMNVAAIELSKKIKELNEINVHMMANICKIDAKRLSKNTPNKIVNLALPQDSVSKDLLKIASSELAIEDTLTEIRHCYRKKKISLDKYLETVRTYSEKQFYNVASKRKILALMHQ